MKRRKELVKVKEAKVQSRILGAKLVLTLLSLSVLGVCAAVQEETADYWYNKSGELFVNGSYEEAIQDLDKALQIEPENATIWQTKGSLLGLIGRKDEALITHQNALESFNQSIENNPDDAKAWMHKAETLRSMNRLEEAVKAYDKAIELLPEKKEDAWIAWENEARILMQLGKHDESLEAYDEAIMRIPANDTETQAFVYGSKGMSLLKLADTKRPFQPMIKPWRSLMSNLTHTCPTCKTRDWPSLAWAVTKRPSKPSIKSLRSIPTSGVGTARARH